jgi:hypothetical protein
MMSAKQRCAPAASEQDAPWKGVGFRKQAPPPPLLLPLGLPVLPLLPPLVAFAGSDGSG